MAKKLLIVESPNKAKKIQQIVGARAKVMATVGHVIDLPAKELGIDVENGFAPQYIIMPDKRQVLSALKEEAKKYAPQDIIIMTDDDREGAAIGWFVSQHLGLRDPLRGVFHEVTESAILRAIENPGKLDLNLVNAQQARRILDRLVGYKTSPILWQKLPQIRESSAGRVQSVALRLVVDRENERRNFVAREYWSVHALYASGLQAEVTGQHKGSKIHKLPELDKATAQIIEKSIASQPHHVIKVEGKKEKGNPPAPLITSTLLQLASSKLRLGAETAQKLAQELFDKGHITYHRTDSVAVAPEAQKAAMDFLRNQYGPDIVPSKPNVYSNKEGAQGAHEAIRPTHLGDDPRDVSPQAKQLYAMITRYFLASQAKPAEFQRTTAQIRSGDYALRATGRVLLEDGYLRIMGTEDLKEVPLPKMKEGQKLDLEKATSKQHFTKPPDRFSEATLIKYLEDKGIGRPSTYHAIVSKIRQKEFVKADGKHLVPTPKGEAIDAVLRADFASVIREDFTAALEDRLDKIAAGQMEWIELLDKFWGHFKTVLAKANRATDGEPSCKKCGAKMRKAKGKFGDFLSCSNYFLTGCKG